MISHFLPILFLCLSQSRQALASTVIINNRDILHWPAKFGGLTLPTNTTPNITAPFRPDTTKDKFSVVLEDGPNQAEHRVLRFTHQDDHTEVFFKLDENGRVVIDFAVCAEKDFQNKNGTYTVSLIVSDPSFSENILWDIADLELLFVGTASWRTQQQRWEEYAVGRRRPVFSYEPRGSHKLTMDSPVNQIQISVLIVLAPWAIFAALLSKVVAASNTGHSATPQYLAFFLVLMSLSALFVMYWLRTCTVWTAAGMGVILMSCLLVCTPSGPSLQPREKVD